MDQPFESEVMEELAAETPLSSADELEEWMGMEGDDFAVDFLGDMDGFEADYAEDDFEEGFEADYAEDLFADDYAEAYEDPFEDSDSLETVLADALDAEDSDAFFRQLLSGISRIAGTVSRGAQTVGRATQAVGRVAGQTRRVAGRVQQGAGQAARSRRPAANLLRQLMPLLQQYASQGFDEWDALEDLADWYADEGMDEALPVIGAIAARATVRPLLRTATTRLSRPLGQQLVRSGRQAAQTLAQRQGAGAVRALSPITRRVGQTALRRGLDVRALPNALRSTTARVATRPAIVRRLSQSPLRRPRGGRGGRMPRRLILQGPVEIRFLQR